MATKASSGAVGINIQGIETIISALDEYKQKVKSALDIKVVDTVLQNAIKGTGSENAFKAATNELKKELSELLFHVDKYKNYLNQMAANYKAHDTSVQMNFVPKE